MHGAKGVRPATGWGVPNGCCVFPSHQSREYCSISSLLCSSRLQTADCRLRAPEKRPPPRPTLSCQPAPTLSSTLRQFAAGLRLSARYSDNERVLYQYRVPSSKPSLPSFCSQHFRVSRLLILVPSTLALLLDVCRPNEPCHNLLNSLALSAPSYHTNPLHSSQTAF